jgi:MoxR-like ATPase
MLLVLNNALAGDELYNSSNGTTIKRHPDFIPVATANTWGTGGSNREYNAREKLDFATLDRWRMGRVFVDLDESVEDYILGLAGK